MENLSLFIKPASGLCNLNCSYCFYYDTLSKRDAQSSRLMTADTRASIVKKALSVRPKRLSLAFQGGEPTLIGLSFFEALIADVARYNVGNTQVYYSLQTNGTLLDDDWGAFLKKHNFLVGLSMDGPQSIHDGCRVNQKGEGTFHTVMNAVQLLQHHQVDFNILSVVTAQVAEHIEEIFHFFKEIGVGYLQFIPCLDPIYEERGQYPHSLTPELFESFLKKLFDLWIGELEAGRYTYIRYFDSLMFLMKNLPSPTCSMNGRCENQMVIEADGSVYPCDFYVLDPYKIGNLGDEDLLSIMEKGRHCTFIQEEPDTKTACGDCPWYTLCRGGCRRDWQVAGGYAHNYYCTSFKHFFAYAYPQLKWVADRISV